MLHKINIYNIKEHKFNSSNKLITLLLCLVTISCTLNVAETPKNTMIRDLKDISQEFNKLDNLLVVKVSNQELYHLKKGVIVRTYSVSTSVYGTGSKINSFKTPLGKHKISEKIGEGLPEGAILKARQWNGAIANIIKEPIDTDFDVVTSRILWLTGLEEGKNLGPGVDSKSRYIYIHGTAEEGLIGKPASDGCVRMYNADVISLFEKVSVDTEVWII